MKALDINKKDLHNMYWVENKTQKEIADDLNVNIKTIYNYLVRFDIRRGRTGEKHCGGRHWNWNGGYINSKGYKVVHDKNHPNSDKKGRILEHRLAMSRKIGRPLKRHEHVHHINGVRTDNRPENLELVTLGTHHSGHKIICPHCGKNITNLI